MKTRWGPLVRNGQVSRANASGRPTLSPARTESPYCNACDLSVENSLPQEEQESGCAGRVLVREFPERREKMFDK